MMNKEKQEMVGRTYSYNGNKIKIAKVKHVEDDLYDLFTDEGKRIRLTTSEMKSELIPISPKEEREMQLAIASGIKNDSSNMAQLEKIMMDTIKSVQKDPKNIPQAKSINDVSKSMIALSKHKLDTAKFLKELHTGR